MSTHKLVRDKIPEIIMAEGKHPQYRVISGDELEIELFKKLEEEKIEYLESHSEEQKIEELVDMIEVLFGIAEMRGTKIEALLKLADKKREERGGFSEGLFWEGNK